jgi:hypothetical protein
MASTKKAGTGFVVDAEDQKYESSDVKSTSRPMIQGSID